MHDRFMPHLFSVTRGLNDKVSQNLSDACFYWWNEYAGPGGMMGEFIYT